MIVKLTRTVRLQHLRRIAAIGKTEKNRSIYLAFLHHIAESPDASYRSINTRMLNALPENQRGKSIVELLVKDGFVVPGETLRLTSLGRAVLAENRMMEPHSADYLFTVAVDPLLPHALYAYKELFQKRDAYKPYVYQKNESAPWLRRPGYPTYAREDSIMTMCTPMMYRLTGDDNEPLYLYAICESGPAAEVTEETCSVQATLDGDSLQVAVTGKKRIVVDSPVSAAKLRKGLNLSAYGVYDDGTGSVLPKTFAEMSAEERRTGNVHMVLHDVQVSGYGVFDTVEVSGIKLVVTDPDSIYAWSRARLFTAVRSYMTRQTYEQTCRDVAVWILDHAQCGLEPDDIISRMPFYDEMVDLMRHPSEEAEGALAENPGLRWFFLAPLYLQVDMRGDAS